MKFFSHPVSNRCKQSGYSLVEVLVGTTLIMFVLAGGFMAYSVGIHFVEASRDEVRATQFAQAKMEEMRTMNWNDLSDMDAKTEFQPTGAFADQFADRYSGVLVIENINAQQKKITCTVSWQMRAGTRSQIFETIFTRGGINDYFVRSF